MAAQTQAICGCRMMSRKSPVTFEFLGGLAHLYNLIPYQRRAKNAGLCGVEVEGRWVPTSDWPKPNMCAMSRKLAATYCRAKSWSTMIRIIRGAYFQLNPLVPNWL